MCRKVDESINHIVSECPKLAQKEYKKRHDWGEELLRTEDILSMIEEQGDSIALVMFSAYLELLLLYHFGDPDDEDEIPTKRQQLQNVKSSRNNIHVSIVTPINPSERSCQLSVKFSVPIKSVHDDLEKRGLVVDTREPDVMKIAPAPLYNSFMDVYRFVTILGEVIDALECGESEK
ncbi:kynureninase-like [Montipora capricornis]|uniref:kynureninase-like n=1 Tax=Montipora capricornis TaxID=246305 RepID=UPI0035F16CEB